MRNITLAGELINIQLPDHVIITGWEFFSVTDSRELYIWRRPKINL